MEEKLLILQVSIKSEDFGLDSGLFYGLYTLPLIYTLQLWFLPHSGIPNLLVNHSLIAGGFF